MLPLLLVAAGAAILVLAAPEAEAQTLINNGVVQLGVHPAAQLNVNGGTPSSGAGTTVVGLRYMPTNADATSPGCPCEGWGVAYDGATNGWANQNFGGTGGSLVPVSFAATPSTAVSVVQVGDLRVTHDFHPSTATANLYEVSVDIRNTGSSAHNDVQYRRVMDWDVEPTYFSEYVTINTVTPVPGSLKYSSDDGFAHPNPLSGPSSRSAVGPPTPGAAFTDNGPSDHGALFDFNFKTLAAGGRVTFNIYYGAAGTEGAANTARAAVGASIWSYGQPSTGPTTGAPNTFIFAFGGGAISGLTCSPASTTVAAGTPVTLSVSGGTPAYTWSSPGGTPASGSGTSYTTSYASPGTYTVTVTDSGGRTGSCTVVVRAPHCSPFSVITTVGTPVTFTASSGTPGYTWTSPGGSPASGSGSSYATSYASPGTYTVTLRDALGGVATCTVTVVTPPVCSGSTSVPMGGTATFTATGGVSPYTWSSPGGTPAGGTGSSHSTTYSSPGTYTVTVTDAYGQMATCRVEVIPCAMTGRAYVAHVRLDDVGGTGYVGPTHVWSEDTGEVWTTGSEHHWAGLANITGPLVVGDVVGATVDTEKGPRCHSMARANVAHIDNGPNMPAPFAPFQLRVAEAWSESDCSGSRGGTTIAYLMVGGVVLIDTTNTPAPNTQYTVGPVTVVLNEHIAGPGVLEVNAVHLTVNGVAEAKILSARSDIHDCATTPPPTDPDPCRPGGNETEPRLGLVGVTTPNGVLAAAPVAVALDPCVCKSLESAGLHCDVCPPPGEGGIGLCDPCNIVNPCEVCGIHLGLPAVSLEGTDTLADPTAGPRMPMPSPGPGTPLCDPCDRLGIQCDPCAIINPCEVCGISPGDPAALPNPRDVTECVPTEGPRCSLTLDDPVGSLVDCVDRVCDLAVDLVSPGLDCVFEPIGPIHVPCNVTQTLVSCLEALCDAAAEPLGADCAIGDVASTYVPPRAPVVNPAFRDSPL